jgi:organic radical activating enzyme
VKSIKRRKYKHKITYGMAQILLENGLASPTKTKEYSIRTYLASKRSEIWVAPIDKNAHFELGQRYELYKNYKMNSSSIRSEMLLRDPSTLSKADIRKRKEYVKKSTAKLKVLKNRFIEMFRLARHVFLSKDPMLSEQLEAMKRVGIMLTRQKVRINPKTHKRLKKARKRGYYRKSELLQKA